MQILTRCVLPIGKTHHLHLCKFSQGQFLAHSQKADRFYWAKIYVEEFRQGDDYTKLNRCITINIVGKGFNLNNKIHSKYLLKEEVSNEKLTNLIEMHFLNLKRAKELNDIKAPLRRH